MGYQVWELKPHVDGIHPLIIPIIENAKTKHDYTEIGRTEKKVSDNTPKRYTPEWVGWTVTGPSLAEGHLPWPGVFLVGELAQVPHYPER